MIPTLNLLSESPGNSGSPALAASTPDGAKTGEAPAAGSFGAILTSQASATLPHGGNSQHPGGKALPLLDGVAIEQAGLDTAASDAVAVPDTATLFSVAAPTEPTPGAALALPAGLSSDGTEAAADGSGLIPVYATGQTAVDVVDAPAATAAPAAPAAVDSVDSVDAAAISVERVVDSDGMFAAVTAEPDILPPPGPPGLSPARQGTHPVVLPRPGPVSNNAVTEPVLMRQEPVPGMEQTPATQSDASVLPEFADLPEAVQARTPGSLSLASAAGPAGMSPAPTETTTASGPRPELMTKPPGDPGWGNEFVGRVSLMIKNGSNEARLQLNPAELGQLDIKITTEGDRAMILFTVQHGAAREAIDLAMPRLREMLEQSGLQLAHSEVADHSQSERGSNGGTGEWGTGELDPSLENDRQLDEVEESVYRVALPDTATVDYYA